MTNDDNGEHGDGARSVGAELGAELGAVRRALEVSLIGLRLPVKSAWLFKRIATHTKQLYGRVIDRMGSMSVNQLTSCNN